MKKILGGFLCGKLAFLQMAIVNHQAFCQQIIESLKLQPHRLPGAEAQVSDFCEAVTACLPGQVLQMHNAHLLSNIIELPIVGEISW